MIEIKTELGTDNLLRVIPVPIEWNGRELHYLAALVRTGGDSPRVPADMVDAYLAAACMRSPGSPAGCF